MRDGIIAIGAALALASAGAAGCTPPPQTVRVSYRPTPDEPPAPTGHLRVSFAPPAHRARLFLDERELLELDARGGVDRVLVRDVPAGDHSIEVRSLRHGDGDGKRLTIAPALTTDVLLAGPAAATEGERRGGLLLAGIALAAGFGLLLITLAKIDTDPNR